MRKKTLCNTLNWENWNSGFEKLGVRWAEQDINPLSLPKYSHYKSKSGTRGQRINQIIQLWLFLLVSWCKFSRYFLKICKITKKFPVVQNFGFSKLFLLSFRIKIQISMDKIKSTEIWEKKCYNMHLKVCSF